MAKMKFYHRSSKPTVAQPDGTHYMKDGDNLIPYIKYGSEVKEVGREVAQDLGDSETKAVSQKLFTFEIEQTVSIKSQIKTVEKYISGVNRFNENNVVHGELFSRDGASPVGIAKLASYSRSELMPIITEGESFTITFLNNANTNILNKNLTFFDNKLNVLSDGFMQRFSSGVVITPPPQAAYFGLNVKSNEYDSIYESLKIESGNTPSEHTDYLSGISVKEQWIGGSQSENKELSSDNIEVKVKGNDLYVSLPFSNEYRQVHKCSIFKGSHGNDNFNFEKIYLSDGLISTESKIVKVCTDDISPVSLEGQGRGFIGGNHGFDRGRRVSIPGGHGLNSQDIGEYFVDENGIKFFIIEITNSSSFFILSENTGTTIEQWFFQSPVGDLTRNDTVIPNEYLIKKQIHPSTNNIKKELYLDGRTLENDGTFIGEELVVVDEYFGLNAPEVLDYVINNKVPWSVAASLATSHYVTFRNTFIFNSKGIIGTNSVYANVSFGQSRYGGISVDPLERFTNGDMKLLIPKTKPFTHSGINMNFAKGQVLNSNFTGSWIYFNKNKWQDNFFPNRGSHILYNDNNSKKELVFSSGMIPIGDGAKEIIINNTNDTFVVNVSRKFYNRTWDNKISINAGDKFQTAWYRQLKNGDDIGASMSFVDFVFGGKLHIIADYGDYIGDDILKIDNKFTGYPIEIIEVSSNLYVHDSFTTKIGVKITKSSSDAGFIYLQIG